MNELLGALALAATLGPLVPARAQFTAPKGGWVTGLEAAEILGRDRDAVIVPRKNSLLVNVRGSGRCDLTFEMAGWTIDKITAKALPGPVSLPMPDPRQLRDKTETVKVTPGAPCGGGASMIVAFGGELTGAGVRTPSVEPGNLDIMLSGRGTCSSVMLSDSRSGKVREAEPVVTPIKGSSNTATFVTMSVDQPGVDTVSVSPGRSCGGTPQKLLVTVQSRAPKAEGGTVTGISARGGPVDAPVAVRIDGKGPPCTAVVLTFGDGSSATLSGPFPINTSHLYPGPARFSLSASGETPPGGQSGACTGSATAMVDVTPRKTIIGAVNAPQKATVNQTIAIAVMASGPSCSGVEVDFGDGARVSGMVPWQAGHQYAKPGTYVITANGSGDCQGMSRATVVIAPKPGPATTDRSEIDRVPRGTKPPVKPGKP